MGGKGTWTSVGAAAGEVLASPPAPPEGGAVERGRWLSGDANAEARAQGHGQDG